MGAFADRLADAVRRHGPLCVGIDPRWESLPAAIRASVADRPPAEQLAAGYEAFGRRVLELVWNSHRPLGAYELLDRLTGEGHKPAPPTVYRALEFLLEQKLVHRIASRNAFIGCTHPGAAHAGYFLLCESCGNAEEIADVSALAKAVEKAAAVADFAVHSQTLELTGLCRHCRK